MDAHPVADLFPMLADEELKDLAADIIERGLLQPIILDDQGRILDGRNRFAACELAGIDPVFETYAGPDPDGYALSVNLSRRHLTKGQQAMIGMAANSLVSNEFGIKERLSQETGSAVSRARFSQAGTVLKYATHLVPLVISGAMVLDKAYAIAREAKVAAEEQDTASTWLRDEAPDLADAVAEERMTIAQAKAIIALRADAPDLADAVVEERMTISEANDALTARREDAPRIERVAEIDEIVTADGGNTPSFTARVERGELTWAEADYLAGQWLRERGEMIDRNATRLRNAKAAYGILRDLRNRPDDPILSAALERLDDDDREALNGILSEIKPRKGR